MKAQTRNTELQINEGEIGKLPAKNYRIMIVRPTESSYNNPGTMFYAPGTARCL